MALIIDNHIKVPILTNIISRFDYFSEKMGRSKLYKKIYWGYLTQDRYFSTGLGKLFVPMQFTSLFGNIGLLLLVLDKVIIVPQWVYKYTVFFVVLLFLCALFLGRFMD